MRCDAKRIWTLSARDMARRRAADDRRVVARRARATRAEENVWMMMRAIDRGARD
jgi:hypothetical protein